MKILFFDTETTGLDPIKQDIIQIAGLVEVDGKIVDEFDLSCQPFSFENIEKQALETNHKTIEELKTFIGPKLVKETFCGILGKHCDKFDRSDKFYPAGYNVKFDIDFLAQWFKKCGDNYLGSWINWRALDPYPFLCAMDFKREISLPDYKLSTVCGHFGIDITGAHDALSDIKATRQIIKKVIGI